MAVGPDEFVAKVYQARQERINQAELYIDDVIARASGESAVITIVSDSKINVHTDDLGDLLDKYRNAGWKAERHADEHEVYFTFEPRKEYFKKDGKS